jgi:hypothetical protein
MNDLCSLLRVTQGDQKYQPWCGSHLEIRVFFQTHAVCKIQFLAAVGLKSLFLATFCQPFLSASRDCQQFLATRPPEAILLLSRLKCFLSPVFLTSKSLIFLFVISRPRIKLGQTYLDNFSFN